MKYALIGEKLGHSYSKIIHRKYFECKNLPFTYDLVEIPHDEFSGVITYMKEQGYLGFNVTIPYKIDILSYCDKLSDEASKIASVNTVKLCDDKVCGYNTDYHGLKLALEANRVSLRDKEVVILGTGGASKAVCTLAKDLGCRSVTFVSRTPKQTDGCTCLTYNNSIKGDVIINTTPVGMFPNIESCPFVRFDGFETAVDLIYNPANTLFLKKAANSGLKAVNGLYMLVAQALYSESIWQDTEPDIDIINKIYNEMRGF